MVYGTDILTPIDQTHTYYFWGVARSYALVDAEGDQFWHDVIKLAFNEQDQPMIEAQQRTLGATSLPDAGPVLFGIDRAPHRVRKVLAELISSDAAPRSENPSTIELFIALRDAPTPVAPCV